MGDHGRVMTLRVPDALAQSLDRVVDVEREHARPGHRVTRHALILIALEIFVTQRLRRVPRETSPPSPV